MRLTAELLSNVAADQDLENSKAENGMHGYVTIQYNQQKCRPMSMGGYV